MSSVFKGTVYNYRKRRKFREVKLSWFFNCRSEVKFHGFRDSLAGFSLALPNPLHTGAYNF